MGLLARRLYRTDVTDDMFGGVCGGIAEYLNVDSNVVRMIAVAAAFLTGGAAVLAYIVAWFIIPSEVDTS